jgi:hypothetical protein
MEDGLYRVVVEYKSEELGRAALEAARELCLAAVFNRPYDGGAAIASLRSLAPKGKPPPGSSCCPEGITQDLAPLSLYIDHGSAPPELIAELYLALDAVYRTHGGAGLRIVKDEPRVAAGEEVAQ